MLPSESNAIAAGEERRASVAGPRWPEKRRTAVPASVGGAWAAARRTRARSTTYTRPEPSPATATGWSKAALALVITANGADRPDLVAQNAAPATTVATTNTTTAAKPSLDRPPVGRVF